MLTTNNIIIAVGALFLIMLISPGVNSPGDWASGMIGLAAVAGLVWYLMKQM